MIHSGGEMDWCMFLKKMKQSFCEVQKDWWLDSRKG